MIVLDNVGVKFKKREILSELDLEISENEVVGLIAPNGMGKTTIFNLIMNNLKPNTGTVTVDGLDYKHKKNRKQIFQKLSILPNQNDLIADYTGREHLKMYAAFWNREPDDIQRVIARLSLDKFIDQKVSRYSLGMRQRLCFGMQLLLNTDYLLMDEVTNGLDIDNIELVEEIVTDLKHEGKGIVIISHLLTSLDKICDRVLFLLDGQIHLQHVPNDSENERFLILKREDYVGRYTAIDFQLEDKVYLTEEKFYREEFELMNPEASFELRELTCMELYKRIYG